MLKSCRLHTQVARHVSTARTTKDLEYEIYAYPRAKSLIHNEKPIVLFKNTTLRLWNQRPFHLQGDAGHSGWKEVDKKRIIRKNGGPRRRGTGGADPPPI
jgi:hypothetical protein